MWPTVYSVQKSLSFENGDEFVFSGKGGYSTGLQALHGLVHTQHLLLHPGLDVARNVEIAIIGGDLLQRDHASDAFHILVRVIPAMDTLDVLGQQFVLGPASL